MRRIFTVFGFLVSCLVLAGGCAKHPVKVAPDYSAETSGMALQKIPPELYPDFSLGWEHRNNLVEAARNSRTYLEHGSSRQFFPYLDITHERALASIDAFIEVLQSARSGQELDQMVRQRFDVYQSRGYPDNSRQDVNPFWKPPDTGIVLFTGYYRPIFDARLKPEGEFRWPLYKKPKELALDPVSMHYHSTNGQPFYTRAEIERGALAGKGLELCFLRDWFESYIVTIQGSAVLRLPGGKYMEIGYAGDNGHEYISVAREMVKQGKIDANKLSLQTMIQYFKQHPEDREFALSTNPRYIFFTQRSGGPWGSLGVPVTPLRSVATDKQIFPRACVCFLVTNLPQRIGPGQIEDRHYGGFALDQDTGNAIRAAGRCDVFMGTGDEVGELAGRTFSEGALYYIFLKNGSPPPGAGTGGTSPPTMRPGNPPGESKSKR